MLSLCLRLTRPRRDEKGVVALNLILVIAFALYAVIQLSRVSLAAKQIKQRVKTITTEVGPGSNVSRLDEVAILDTVAARADQILAAAKPLSGQANDILTAARSIDSTGSSILDNAQQINGTARSINGTFQTLAPVVNNIKGRPGNIDATTPADRGGVEAINIRVDNALRNVAGIGADLDATNANVTQINAWAADISAFARNPLQDPVQLVSGITCSTLGLLCP
jgi:hypothetical protein